MSSASESHSERTVEVRNPSGLHMRPAMQLVERAGTFAAQITICKGDLCVDGKSIMQVTMLAAGPGTRLTIKAHGPDADAAIVALAELVESQTCDDVTS